MWWSFYLCCLCNTLSRILSSFLSTWRHTITKTGKSDVMTTELVHWSTWRHTTIKSDVMIWPPTWFNAMWPRLHWWRPFIMTSCLVFQADMMTLTKFLHHVNINHSEKFVPNLNCLKQDLFCLGLSNCLRCPRLPGCVLNVRGCLGVSTFPNFHGNRLEFRNSDFARCWPGPARQLPLCPIWLRSVYKQSRR